MIVIFLIVLAMLALVIFNGLIWWKACKPPKGKETELEKLPHPDSPMGQFQKATKEFSNAFVEAFTGKKPS